MPTLAMNMNLPNEKSGQKDARKIAPQPKSGGKSALTKNSPKSKRENTDKPKPKRKYNKRSDYWKKKKKK